MKKTTFYLLVILITTLGFSQEFPTYNSILGIERYHLTTDFGLSPDISPDFNFNYPKEVSMYKIASLIGEDGYYSQRRENFTFKSDKLIASRYTSYSFAADGEIVLDLEKKYEYNEKNQLVKFMWYDDGKPSNEGFTYTYFPDGNIKEIKGLGREARNSKMYEQKDDNGLIYLVENASEYQRSYMIVSTIGKKVRFITNLNKKTGVKTESNYGYVWDEGDNTMTPTQIVYKSPKEEIKYYIKDGNTLTRKSITNLENNDVRHEVYYNTYDKFGNWVISYQIVKGNNLDFVSKTAKNIYIRSITYEDGTTTGYNDPKNPDLKSELEKIKQQIFWDKDVDFEENPKWKKNDEGTTYWLYVNGKGIADKCVWLYLIDDNAVVYYPQDKQFYLMKNYKAKEANSLHEAIAMNVKGSNDGFWLSNGENFFLYDVNGKEYDYNNVFEKFEYDNNGHMIAFQKNGEKLLMEHAKSIQPYIIKPLEKYNYSISENKTVNPNSTTTKPYEEESDYTWKRTESGSYWLYKNATQITGMKSMWLGNSLLVWDTRNNNLVNLRGFKDGAANTNYKAYKINVNLQNGFWYKVEDNKYYAYDSNGNQVTNLEINKWSSDNKSLIIKSNNSNLTYIMNNYNAVERFKVYPLEIYK